MLQSGCCSVVLKSAAFCGVRFAVEGVFSVGLSWWCMAVSVDFGHGTPSEGQLFTTKHLGDPVVASAGSTWDSVLLELRGELDAQVIAAWLKPLRHQKTERPASGEPEIYLAASNKFAADHIRAHYIDRIARAASRVLGAAAPRIRISVDASALPTNISSKIEAAKDVLKNISALQRPVPAAVPATDRPKPVARPRPVRTSAQESNLNAHYEFSNFIVGSCNQFAYAASMQTADNLGATFNPLFIYGGVGLGKTHLVNAIGNAALRKGKKVLLVSSESFVNELIAALRANRMQQFKSKFRSLDVLIIDDVQFIMGKERTQEEFFHTFNELHQRRKQIIITSDKVPQKLTGLEERLRTRFASGLTADLQAPDFETRVAILVKKAEQMGLSLAVDVAQFVAEKISTNIRELEGALNQISAFSSVHRAPLSLSLAEEALRGHIADRTVDISAELIQRTVAKKHNITINELLGKRRTQNVALARQIAMYLCRRMTGCSFPEIGALFGGRDHSTVIHAQRVIEERMAADSTFRNEIAALKNSIGE